MNFYKQIGLCKKWCFEIEFFWNLLVDYDLDAGSVVQCP